MSGIKNKYLIINSSIDKILKGTQYEKYSDKLKINGILNLKDINTMRNNTTLGTVLQNSIGSEKDIVGVMELFDKKIQNSYGVFSIIVLSLSVWWIHYLYRKGLFDYWIN